MCVVVLGSLLPLSLLFLLLPLAAPGLFLAYLFFCADAEEFDSAVVRLDSKVRVRRVEGDLGDAMRGGQRERSDRVDEFRYLQKVSVTPPFGQARKAHLAILRLSQTCC